jgi:hypothetical protein
MYAPRGMVPLIMKLAIRVLAIVVVGEVSCPPWEMVG